MASTCSYAVAASVTRLGTPVFSAITTRPTTIITLPGTYRPSRLLAHTAMVTRSGGMGACSWDRISS